MADEEINLLFEIPLGANFRLEADGRMYGIYVMTIALKDKPDGVGCQYCGQIIGEDCYYCEDDGIFMHKKCLVKLHRPALNVTLKSIANSVRTEHEDKCVNVKFVNS